jgi:hypothetical protein
MIIRWGPNIPTTGWFRHRRRIAPQHRIRSGSGHPDPPQRGAGIPRDDNPPPPGELTGRCAVASEWLVATTWNIGKPGDPEASQGAHSIELALAEVSSGLQSPEERDVELRALVRQVSSLLGTS